MQDQSGAIESLQLQVESLYAEKAYLEQELGTADPYRIRQMMRDMEQQLVDLYREKEDCVVIDGNSITIAGPKRIIIRRRGQQ